MLTEKSRQALKTVKKGTRVRFQVLDFKSEVPELLGKDSLALLAAGQPADGHGTKAAAEVWIVNTAWSPETERVLEASPLRYKFLVRSI